MNRIYLDTNATSRPFPEVVDAIRQHLTDAFANPGGRHAEGRQARQILESARESIAARLGASPEEVIFTSGGTESINLALRGLAPTGGKGLATLPGEHPATSETARQFRQFGTPVQFLPIDRQGRLLPDGVDEVAGESTGLVSLLLAHNETGVIQPLDRLARRCREQAIPLHLDAVQAVGKIPVRFHELDCAALSFGAHKFHGPRGIGGLLLRKGVRLKPFTTGGHQESGRRPGTECVALAAGMAVALEKCVDEMQTRSQRQAELRNRLQAALMKQCAPCQVAAGDAPRLPNTLMMLFSGLDAEALLVNLDLAGIACSAGTTCASGSAEPSPMLMAMGYSESEARSAIRFSVSADNTPEEIDEAIRRITEIVHRLRQMAGSTA